MFRCEYFTDELGTKFPKEITIEIELFFQTIVYEYIDKHLMYKIVNTIKKYLPYLEDGEKWHL